MSYIKFKGFHIDTFYVAALVACIILMFVQKNILDIFIVACIVTLVGALDAYADKANRDNQE